MSHKWVCPQTPEEWFNLPTRRHVGLQIDRCLWLPTTMPIAEEPDPVIIEEPDPVRFTVDDVIDVLLRVMETA